MSVSYDTLKRRDENANKMHSSLENQEVSLHKTVLKLSRKIKLKEKNRESSFTFLVTSIYDFFYKKPAHCFYETFATIEI